jgi:hypothetical protein
VKFVAQASVLLNSLFERFLLCEPGLLTYKVDFAGAFNPQFDVPAPNGTKFGL